MLARKRTQQNRVKRGYSLTDGEGRNLWELSDAERDWKTVLGRKREEAFQFVKK